MGKELEQIEKKLTKFGMRVLKENSSFMKENAQISIDFNEAKVLLSELNRMESDIKYLLSFAPKDKPDNLQDNMSPCFYHSLSYNGDIKILERIQKILERIQKIKEVHNVQN